MDWTTFYVSSVTNAMRGKKLLEQHGFTVYIKHSSAQGETDGCGYSLQVRGDAKTAKQLLARAGIRLLRIEHGGGGL
ncbi:MAG: DUF3343 domain-containing protein [Clostridia bacterium]|nr:DUF3343 domain-containing protein [Clostridia bacterium]